jgi:hypothetical protein
MTHVYIERTEMPAGGGGCTDSGWQTVTSVIRFDCLPVFFDQRYVLRMEQLLH